jgi:ribokinase
MPTLPQSRDGSRPRVAVVGSLNMDLVVRGPRFPRAGETLTGTRFETIPGGKGANQALAARRAGAQVTMVGAVGADDFGAALRAGLATEGVDVQHVAVAAGVATGVALITVDVHGENTIIVVPGANGCMTAEAVQAAAAAITAARVLLLQLEVPLAAVHAAARVAAEAGVTVILNAAPALVLPGALLALVDYLVVNETEVLEVGAHAGVPADRAARALQSAGARTVVVTLGAAGALLMPPAGDVVATPAFEVEAVDTTAAGDAFVGAFAVALAEGATPSHALRVGSAAGALAVTRPGAQPSLPSRADIETLLASDPGPS